MLGRGPSAYSPRGERAARGARLRRRHCRTQPASLPDLDYVCKHKFNARQSSSKRADKHESAGRRALAFALSHGAGARVASGKRASGSEPTRAVHVPVYLGVPGTALEPHLLNTWGAKRS